VVVLRHLEVGFADFGLLVIAVRKTCEAKTYLYGINLGVRNINLVK
jgi:hypothetical protein